MRTSQPRREADKSQKIMTLMKNLLTQWETEEKNRTKDQLMKNLQNSMKNVGEKPIHYLDIADRKIDEKPLNPMGSEEENRS